MPVKKQGTSLHVMAAVSHSLLLCTFEVLSGILVKGFLTREATEVKSLPLIGRSSCRLIYVHFHPANWILRRFYPSHRLSHMHFGLRLCFLFSTEPTHNIASFLKNPTSPSYYLGEV